MLIGEYEKTEDMIEICEALRLHCIKEEKFNTNFISVIWTMPAERHRATKIALIAEALRLGPGGDRKSLDEKLAEAFAAYKEGLKKKIVKANEELKEVKFEYKTN